MIEDVKAVDDGKVCFITCVNDEETYAESRLYMEHLAVPVGMQVEFRAVRGAESMAAGYEAARQSSTAKYKIYLHQDVMLLKKDLVQAVVSFFSSHPKAGLLGLAGCVHLPPSLLWWEAREKFIGIAQASQFDRMQRPQLPLQSVQVQAVDGVFMAAQYDVPWREDALKGWHFYDISASLEYQKQGLEVWLPEQAEYWLMHLTKRQPLGAEYYTAADICRNLYAGLLAGSKQFSL